MDYSRIAIIGFLEYDPCQQPRGSAKLVLSQRRAAVRLDVDPSTLARWERGEKEPRAIRAAC